MLFFDAEYLRNGTTYRHSVIEIPIETYTRLTQQCHFEWSWVTLSDLGWLSKIFNDTKRRAVSLRQLSFLFWDTVCTYVCVYNGCRIMHSLGGGTSVVYRDTVRLAWRCVWSVDAARPLSLFSRNGLCQPACLQPGQSPPKIEACIRAKEGNGGGNWRGLLGFITTVSLTANTHCQSCTRVQILGPDPTR